MSTKRIACIASVDVINFIPYLLLSSFCIESFIFHVQISSIPIMIIQTILAPCFSILSVVAQPYWHHNCTCRLLAKECARRARASLLSLCWASSWRRLHFAVAAEVPLRARECECLLLGIELPFYTCTHNNVPGISHSSSVNTQKTWRLFL